MIEKFVVAYVATKPDLVALVGDRVRAGQDRTEDVGKDRIYFFQVDGPRLKSLKGPSGLAMPRLQFGIISADYGRAKLIARLLAGTKGDERLNGYKGTLAGIDVRSFLLTDERALTLPPQGGQGIGETEVQQDYSVCWDEQAAAVA